MRINDDLSVPVIVHGAALEWGPSPSAGVERRMLYRVGDEVARASSVVRYAPGSSFPRHTHHGGEEILVLAGTFQDERGDYPAGCYFRNPPGTSHTPASKEGCTIFVRLWQFRQDDRTQIVCRPDEGQAIMTRPGASRALQLFADGYEEVCLEDWQPNATIAIDNSRGLEIFVVSGELQINGEILREQSWGRFPQGQSFNALVGASAATVWIKDAPLEHHDVVAMP